MYRPEFTQEQKDWICYQIGDWYLMMKPLLEGQHNLGYMKEKLKIMVCDDEVEMPACCECDDYLSHEDIFYNTDKGLDFVQWLCEECRGVE